MSASRSPRRVPARNSSPARLRRSLPLRLEALEDRWTPARFTVRSLLDDGSAGTLRDAILQANAAPGPDTVDFDAALSLPGTISLQQGQLPVVTGDLTITGPGAARLTVDAHQDSGILQVNAGAAVGVTGLTLTGGNTQYGGAIRNDGTLAVRDSTLSGNSASVGGAIRNFGTLTVAGSTVAANTAGVGGGIRNDGTLWVFNSTVSANYATSGGGLVSVGPLAVTNSTFSGNSSNAVGGGIRSFGPFQLNNSIVANSPSGGDVVGDFTGGHNLFGTVPLGPLADNGGPTWTHAPAGSPAVNAGDPAVAVDADGHPLTVDQRGAGRDGRPDIGSFEFTDFRPGLVVTTLADEDDGTSDPRFGTGTSLREAVAYANAHPGADAVTFDAGLALPGTIRLQLGQLPLVTGELTITGPGADRVTLDAHGASRILEVDWTAVVGLSGLTLANGWAVYGGGVHNNGTLAISNCALTGNYAYRFGGGVFNDGVLSVSGSTVTNNSVGDGFGGGIFTRRTLQLTDSELSGNQSSSRNGGGLWIYGRAEVTRSILTGNTAREVGGGIVNGGSLEVSNSTLSGNSAGNGGAIQNYGTLRLTDSTLSGNHAVKGGGVYNWGTVWVVNSLISGNVAAAGGGICTAFWDLAAIVVANSTLSRNSAGNRSPLLDEFRAGLARAGRHQRVV